MAASNTNNTEPAKQAFGAIGGDGASLRLYASSNQDIISLNYQIIGSGLVETSNPFAGLGIYWIDDLKAHLSGTEEENHRG